MKTNTDTVPPIPLKGVNVQTTSANTDVRSQVNSFQDLFDRQRHLFATGVTRSYAWRIEQLDRMGRLLQENEAALQRAVAQDFKTASQEQIFETFACLSEVINEISSSP